MVKQNVDTYEVRSLIKGAAFNYISRCITESFITEFFKKPNIKCNGLH